MKTRIAAWIAAIFMGVAFTAMPSLDAQDQYLQTTQTETAAERVAKLDRQAAQEAAELERHIKRWTTCRLCAGWCMSLLNRRYL